MAEMTYDKRVTALLVIDPYKEDHFIFMSSMS